LPLAKIQTALANLSAVGGRLHSLLGLRNSRIFDDSYNANPSSLKAGLEVLANCPAPRYLVLGDMLELGGASRGLHEELRGPLQQAGCDLVFACGPFMRALWETLPEDMRGGYAASSAELESAVLAAVKAGDVIMIKGSLGSRMGPLVAALKKRFKECDSA
jgi:UDP-N-acetylmuramoyl-tripeptide--D-alanyl-D-alanine ligase